MNLLVDTNILLYSVNPSVPQHKPARAFIEELRQGEGFCVTWSVLYEWCRVATHLAVFPRPLSPAQASAFVAAMAADPRIDILLETPRHSLVLADVLAGVPPIRGNLFHDIHIATVMREHGISKIATADRHFRLFPFLEVVDPCS